MKTLITLFIALGSIVSMNNTAFASSSNNDYTYIYDRSSNKQIEIELIKSPKYYKSFAVRNENNQVVVKGKIENQRKVAFSISDLTPGIYYIEINGYKEKVIIK